MAEGIVTSSDREFREILSERTDEVRALALSARDLIFDVFPETVEVVWSQQRSAGYGTGPRKMSDQFAWILPAAKHVALAFPLGAELPDPEGLLQGTGARIRNVRLASPADVERPATRALLVASLERRLGR